MALETWRVGKLQTRIGQPLRPRRIHDLRDRADVTAMGKDDITPFRSPELLNLAVKPSVWPSSTPTYGRKLCHCQSAGSGRGFRGCNWCLTTLQKHLDVWLEYYNNEPTRLGKMCCGRTPMATLQDGKAVWKEKFLG